MTCINCRSMTFCVKNVFVVAYISRNVTQDFIVVCFSTDLT